MSSNTGWPDGYDLIELPEVDSTNAYAARGVRGFLRPTWIRADRQTKGRGRSGRTWISQDGNLFATLIYRPDCAPTDAALRTYVASLALFDALAEVTSPNHLSLKWPNDVLFKGGKIAGILLESETKEASVDWLAIGIGVNLASAPDADPGAAFVPVSLPEPVAPGEFLARLAVHFSKWDQIFVEQGFEPLRKNWLGKAARLGETLTARTRNEAVKGTFVTVDEVGNLVLDTPKGGRSIAAADIFFD